MEMEQSYVEIDGIKIFPWTQEQILKLAPILEEATGLIEERGLSLQEIRNLTKSPKKMMHAIFQFLPLLTPIVSITLDLPREEVLAWPFDKVARVTLTIMIENASKVNQFLSLSKILLKDSKFLN